MLFKKPKPRLVLIHHSQMDDSIEGILIGRIDGHYHVQAPKLVGKAARANVPLQGDILIPTEKVAFIQLLATDQR